MERASLESPGAPGREALTLVRSWNLPPDLEALVFYAFFGRVSFIALGHYLRNRPPAGLSNREQEIADEKRLRRVEEAF